MMSCPTARVTGGWRDETCPRNGQNPKLRKRPIYGANPAVRVHAVLGGFYGLKPMPIAQPTWLSILPFLIISINTLIA